MKTKIYINFLIAWLAITTMNVQGEELPSNSKKEIRELIENMYSYDPATFEYGEFDKKNLSAFKINQKNIDKNSKYFPEKNAPCY
ncbi:hypothetical protein [Uliginosibacterium sediminicola]|uniref:Uncharacterized protein n=1 Tax=Uliginosibacterium sediminicola TaxID=2024550 RepID=A0ABU9Z0J7_9RHOO